MAAHLLSNEVGPSQLELQPLTCPRGRRWGRWEQAVGEELSQRMALHDSCQSRKSGGFVVVREHPCGRDKGSSTKHYWCQIPLWFNTKIKRVYTNKPTNPTIHLVCKAPGLYFKMESCLLREVIITEIKWGIILCTKAFRMQFVWSAASESREECHVSCDISKRIRVILPTVTPTSVKLRFFVARRIKNK